MDEFKFKINHRPYYIYDNEKNNVQIIKKLFPMDES